MMAQKVVLFIVGVSAIFMTPWGEPPVTGQAFEEEAIDAILVVNSVNVRRFSG